MDRNLSIFLEEFHGNIIGHDQSLASRSNFEDNIGAFLGHGIIVWPIRHNKGSKEHDKSSGFRR
jgi:hypothetical protein